MKNQFIVEKTYQKNKNYIFYLERIINNIQLSRSMRTQNYRPKSSMQIDKLTGNELPIRQMKTQNSCSHHFIKYLTKYNKILADFIERESEDFNQDSGSSILDSITQQQIQAYLANEKNRQIKKSLTQCLRKPYGLIFSTQQKQRVFILSMDILTSFIQQIFQSFSERRKGQIALDKKKIEKFKEFKKNGALFFEKIEKIVVFLNKMEKKYFFKVEQLQTLTAKVRKVQHENSELKGQIKGLENLPKLVDEIKREKNGEGQSKPRLELQNSPEHEFMIARLKEELNSSKIELEQKNDEISILKSEVISVRELITEPSLDSGREVQALPAESKQEAEQLSRGNSMLELKTATETLKSSSEQIVIEKDRIISDLQVKNSILNQQNNQLKAKVSELEAQIQTLKNNQSKRQNEIIELKEIAAKSLSEVQAQLTAMSEQTKSHADTLEKNNKEIEDLLSKLKKDDLKNEAFIQVIQKFTTNIKEQNQRFNEDDNDRDSQEKTRLRSRSEQFLEKMEE